MIQLQKEKKYFVRTTKNRKYKKYKSFGGRVRSSQRENMRLDVAIN